MAFGRRAGAYGAWLLLLSNFFATMATAVPAGIYTLELLAPAHAQDPLWAACVGGVWIVASSVLLYVGIRPTAVVSRMRTTPVASGDGISPRWWQGVQPSSHAQRPCIRSAPPLGHTGGTSPAIIIG